MEELSIAITEEEIVSLKKNDWKKYVHEIIKETAFVTLVNETKEKSKTQHIYFEKLEMSKYLVKNINTSLSKIIFSVKAGIYDVKIWNEWNLQTHSLCNMKVVRGNY